MVEPSNDPTDAPYVEHTSVSEEALPSVSDESLPRVSKENNSGNRLSDEDFATSMTFEEGGEDDHVPYIMQGLPNLYTTTLCRSSRIPTPSRVVI